MNELMNELTNKHNDKQKITAKVEYVYLGNTFLSNKRTNKLMVDNLIICHLIPGSPKGPIMWPKATCPLQELERRAQSALYS